MNTQDVTQKLDTTFTGSPKVEGALTKAVEHQTAKAPSMTWLGLAVGSMAVSAGLQLFTERKELGNFVGMWAPCFLMIGIYNKIVKVEGSDHLEASSKQNGQIH